MKERNQTNKTMKNEHIPKGCQWKVQTRRPVAIISARFGRNFFPGRDLVEKSLIIWLELMSATPVHVPETGKRTRNAGKSLRRLALIGLY